MVSALAVCCLFYRGCLCYLVRLLNDDVWADRRSNVCIRWSLNGDLFYCLRNLRCQQSRQFRRVLWTGRTSCWKVTVLLSTKLAVSAIAAIPASFVDGKTFSYLVDPASSHMLVSKIKPCMSKYKLLQSETANGSLGHPWFLRSYNSTWITVVILELIHASKLRPLWGKSAFIRPKPIGLSGSYVWWLWITLCGSHGLDPATYLSSVCPINFRWYVICLPWL